MTPLPSNRAASRRAWLLAGAGAVAAAAARRSAAAAPPDASAFAANFEGMRLRDQDDRAFRLDSLAGRVVLFHFVFTGCSTICPAQTHVLAEVQRGLGADVRRRVHFVSVSVDPLADTPAALRAFALRMGADLRTWSFVTGRPEDIDRLADRLRLFRAAPGAVRPGDHATALWLVDARGRLAQRYGGNPPDAIRLGQELATYARL
ncbi:MAG: SCO family protein [Xylophilus ampelinus]